MGAMKLDGFLSGMQFGSDLFIEHARNDMAHNLALSRRERAVARPHYAQALLLGAGDAVAFESLVDG
jgi:hypothetical protein